MSHIRTRYVRPVLGSSDTGVSYSDVPSGHHQGPTPGYRPGRPDDRAPCRTHRAELWFPESSKPEASAEAKELCRQCPFQSPCLSHALSTDEKFGVWGGVNMATEGRALRQRLARGRRTGSRT